MDCLPAHGHEPFPFDGVEFAARASAPPPSRAQRGCVAAFVIALHALFAWIVEVESQRRDDVAGPEEQPVVVAFIESLPRLVIRAEPVSEAPPMRIVAPRAPAPRIQAKPSRAAPPTDTPLRLYRPDGALRLPDGLMGELDRKADAPQFDFQYPGVAEGAKAFARPPALVYEATRFDAHWEPANEDVVTEVLRKAVEKSTAEVRIPIPGAPGKRFVCRIAILAASGSCGVESNGDPWFPGYDDPATLDPEEAAACQQWWDKIVGATSQAQWRATRKLYESECRKPLLKVPPHPRAQ
jgi:hypothetical protein